MRTLLMLGALLGTAPLAALAQGSTETSGFPEVVPGSMTTGELQGSLPALGGRGPFTVYRFEAEPGVRYGAEVRSDDFDAYLILARPVGGITEFLREDDDGGGGTDARLRFTLDRPGPHLLIVQGLDVASSGAFTLVLEERELPAPQPPRPVVPGTPVSGQIGEQSSILLSDWDTEIPYELWTFEGEGGQHLVMSLDSDAFDAYVEFGPMSGGEFSPTLFDDDGGEGTNARLRVQLPHDGRFGIRARPLSEGSTGAYTLRVDPFEPQPATRSVIAADGPVAAELTLEDAILPEGAGYQEWVYQGEAGERLEIRMRSDDFDSYLVLGRETPDGMFTELASNDDAPGEGLNAGIDIVLPADGEFIIRTRSLGSGQTGTYTVEVRRLP